jgi:hypothetical protein
MQAQREIVVKPLGRRWLVLLSLVALIAVATSLSATRAAPREAPAAARGSYYLTESTFLGNETLDACAEGYHMASLWEVLDVSNLRYDTVLGYQHAAGDCGEGPPTAIAGWVRTGAIPSIGTIPGGGNCGVWSQHWAGEWGTVVSLPNDWASPGSTVGVWVAGTRECSTSQRVWCVRPPFYVYLPLVLRNY